MADKVVAMILAGGKGTRLKALTKKVAKPAVSFGAKYKIIDFQNEWEVTREVQYEDEIIYNSNNEPIGGKAKNVWPIVVQAKTKNELYPDFYFYENDNWKGKYDVNFNYFIRTEIKGT